MQVRSTNVRFTLIMLAATALLQSNENPFTVDNTTRIAIGRNADKELVVKFDTERGPRTDGFKEIDVSWETEADGKSVLILQSQSVFDQLDLTEDEINEVGAALSTFHVSGNHVATYGAKDYSYAGAKNVDLLELVDNEWKRYDATKNSGMRGFQQLDDGKIGVRVGEKLSAVSVDDFAAAVKDGKAIEFNDDTTIDIPKSAKLTPRMIDEDGNLALAYVDNGKTVIAKADEDGKYTAMSFTNDDVVGNAIPYATIQDGNVDGELGYFDVNEDTGTGDRRTGMSFSQLLTAPSVGEQPQAK